MIKIYNKLVRDKIPEIIKNNGGTPKIRILEDGEYKLELKKKLSEECREVIDANGSEDMLEELADVLEVIKALSELEKKTLEDIILISNQKVLKRGAFNDKIYLESVEEN